MFIGRSPRTFKRTAAVYMNTKYGEININGGTLRSNTRLRNAVFVVSRSFNVPACVDLKFHAAGAFPVQLRTQYVLGPLNGE